MTTKLPDKPSELNPFGDNEPCPFCGSRSLFVAQDPTEKKSGYGIMCVMCAAVGPAWHPTHESAWALWNMRTQESDL